MANSTAALQQLGTSIAQSAGVASLAVTGVTGVTTVTVTMTSTSAPLETSSWAARASMSVFDLAVLVFIALSLKY